MNDDQDVAQLFSVRVLGSAAGRPLLFLHPALTFEALEPLVREPRLRHRQIVQYRRRGYAGGPLIVAGFDMSGHARDAAAVMDRIGMPEADVVAHSIGCSIAMQLAHDAPARVRSLTLIEPTFVSRPEVVPAFEQAIAPVADAYARGQTAEATDRLLTLLDTSRYREVLDRAFAPGWFARTADALDVYFRFELAPAVAWQLPGNGTGPPFQVPVLLIGGENTFVPFQAVFRDLQARLPQARAVIVHGAGHNVAAADPAAVSTLIDDFLADVDAGRLVVPEGDATRGTSPS